MAKNRIPTPLEYVHWLAGWPAPEEEPEVQQVPVPTPIYLPNPRMIDEQALYGGGGMGGPSLPPPIAPPPPPGMSGNGMGMYAPEGGMFG